MAKDRTILSRPIHLSFRSEKRVVVEPDDQDRFVVTMREAALACKSAEDDKVWEEKFGHFLAYLDKWGEENASNISSILVSTTDGALNVLVCTLREYDFDLVDTITELDLSLTQEFPWLVAEVMQVPGNVQGERIPFEKAMLVYGDGKRTQTAGSA